MKHWFNRQNNNPPLLRLVLFLAVSGFVYAAVYFSFKAILTWLGSTSEGIPGLFVFLINYSIMPASVILGTYFSLRIFEKKDLRAIGLGRKKGVMKELLIGVLIGFLLTGLIFAIELMLGWVRIKGYAWNYVDADRYAIFLCKTFILYSSVALTEEVSIRGYLMNQLEQMRGVPFAIILSSIVFGLLHLFNAAGTWAIYVAPFSLAWAGVLMALLYYWKRSLWIPMGFHFAWNFFEYEFFSLTGYGESRSVFFVTELTGPPFWVGLPHSSFGPEVGALGVLSIAIGIAAVLWIKRHGARNTGNV